MKRLLSVVMMVALFSAAAIPTLARARRGRAIAYAHSATRARTISDRQPERDSRSFWEKHRDKLTVGAGAVSGAVIGGLIGGKRGAGIGILAGGSSSALYTYKLRKKDRRY